ncbi:tRNA dimethylallyltransferase, mitochondrial [Polyrhizophydium stewartii]|uniref:tRNA dimethylallyltransferase, mitochondrial n=1 Tax=Polyrhizophydium stewartii TaxID=2732419 RepID=A0ABR4NAH4_9FUNG|nr:hypothetical protein HK105_000832 [Polyrhizophydium stewartii]
MGASPLSLAGSALPRRLPVLAVVGTTGVGKSKLAVQLALALGGHVVNADSMQVYRGLDIATNKPSPDERAAVPHHLLDFVDPAREYSVSEFARDAQAAIDAIHAQHKIPVLVGGTHYYIQSLLWDEAIIATAPTARLSDQTPLRSLAHESVAADPELCEALVAALEETDPRLRSPSQIADFVRQPTLHNLLQRVDPAMAMRWHPNDGRKIRRSIEIFYTTGRPHSDWIRQQAQDSAARPTQLRYPTLVFWLYGDPKALYPRLDSRMGLFDEMQQMRRQMLAGQVVGHAPASDAADSDAPASDQESQASGRGNNGYTRGVMQAIGFKEFDAYFTALESRAALECAAETPLQTDQPDTHAPQTQAALAALDRKIAQARATGIDDMKRATRQYARRQVTWIRNKLAPLCLAEHAAGTGAFYLLDATELDDWDSLIHDTAVHLAREFISSGGGGGDGGSGTAMQDPRELSETAREMLPPLGGGSFGGGGHDDGLGGGSFGGGGHDDGLGSGRSDGEQAGDDATPLNPHSAHKARTLMWEKKTCPVCVDPKTRRPRVLNGKHEWDLHVKTRGHRTNAARASKQQQQDSRHQPQDPLQHSQHRIESENTALNHE